MKIPATQCHWFDQSKDNLSSIAFDLFVMKVDDTVEEFGSQRKGTRVDTIVDGLTKYANKNIINKLVGKKLIVSSSGKPLYITTLPVEALKKVPLPKELEDSLVVQQTSQQKTTSSFDALANAFGVAANSTPANSDDKRIGFGAKELFKQIAAHLRPVYSDETGDIFILEVMADPCPAEFANSVLRGGEKIDDKETKFCISFGFKKEVE